MSDEVKDSVGLNLEISEGLSFMISFSFHSYILDTKGHTRDIRVRIKNGKRHGNGQK